MIVLGIETATSRTSVALGSETGILGEITLAGGRPQHELVSPATEQLLRWTGQSLQSVGGIAVGLGPGLFTGLRVGVETAKTLAQVLRIPLVALPSLDVLAFRCRYSRRLIGAVIDARRSEVFFALYRSTPGGVERITDYTVASADALAGELEARREESLLVGDGALRYREVLEDGSRVEFAEPGLAYPHASSLVELSIPRFHREEYDRALDVAPLYLRKSDAEIAWDHRARAG